MLSLATKASFAGWAALAVAPSADGARTDAHPLHVASEACPGIDGREVQRLVELELRAVTQEVREGPPLGVELRCDAGRLTIAVSDPVTGKHLERDIPAPPDEPGQERVVALAVAQLFAASWLELLIPEAPSDPPEPEPTAAGPAPPTPRHPSTVSPEAVRAAQRVARTRTEPARSLELMVGTGVRGRSLETTPFPAARIDTEVRGWLSPSIGVIGRVGFDIGQASRTRGQVRTYAVTAGGGLGWRLRTRRAVGIGGYALLAGGWAHLQGIAARDDVAAASNQGGTGELAVGIGPRVWAGRFRMDIDAEIGGMLRTPQGTVAGETPVTLGGIWGGVVLRLGAELMSRP
jgi:hypothetical protein